MGNLIQTIIGENYSRIDDRAFVHNGCIIDLGCIRWNWSQLFIGKKRVIGVDPFENEVPEGAELFKGVVGSFDGLIKMTREGDASRISISDSDSGEWITSISWKSFCSKFDITDIAILKMNIEGAEFPLLHSMDSEDFSKIDQIIVSFHDWMNPSWKSLTDASMYMLNQHGFKIQNIGPYGWHMGCK
jgi:hypothetical protein